MQMVTVSSTKQQVHQEHGKPRQTAGREGQGRALDLEEYDDFDSCDCIEGIFRPGQRKKGEDAGYVQIQTGDLC